MKDLFKHTFGKTAWEVVIVFTICVVCGSGASFAWATPALTSTAAPAATTNTATVADGPYIITSALRSSAALDVSGASKNNGAKVQIYDSNTTPAQRWRIERIGKTGYYRIVNVGSGKVLDVAGGVSKAGTRVQQYSWNNSVAQKWKIAKVSGGYRITSALSNKLVLDVAGANKRNGTGVQIYTANGTKAQVWNLSKITQALANGTYTFTNKGSGKVLEVKNASKASGANVQQYAKNNTAAQAFKVTFNKKTGYYVVENIASSKVLDVSGASTKNGANVQQWTSNDTPAQRWTITKNSDGSLTLKNAASGKVLDVSGGSKANGANVQQWQSNGTAAQKWTAAKAVIAKPTGGKRTYDKLNFTLSQMVQWNWDQNPYNKKYLDSIDVLRSHIDPAKQSKYQFADLRKTTGTTAGQLNAFISSTSSGLSGKLKGTGAYFVEAAKTYKLNQDYLLANAILESGWGTSELASGYSYAGGYIDGVYYPAGTYYNFYGIGAYDSSPLSGGRKAAIVNGWNSPKKAILGAAKWIAANYTYRSEYPQYTLYGMKWDYLRSNATGAYGWHQYASGGHWAQGIADIMARIYARTGTDSSVNYIYPQYK